LITFMVSFLTISLEEENRNMPEVPAKIAIKRVRYDENCTRHRP
jgi:hypothetical protein